MKLHSIAASVLLITSITSCGSLPTASLAGLAGGGGGNAMVDQIKSQDAPNALYLPSNAQVGQAWTISMGSIEQRTAIVAEKDGMLVVEQTSFMDADVLEAYLVDPSVDMAREVKAGEMYAHNVEAAWVGAKGDAPAERGVTAPMEMPETSTSSELAVDSKTGNETISLGGRSWDATWNEFQGNRSWSAEGLTLKATMNGETTLELTKWENDAEPELNWDGGDKE